MDPPSTNPLLFNPINSHPKWGLKPRKPKRKDTQIPQSSGPINNVADEAVNEEMDDSLVRAATAGTSLDAEQDKGNINKTQSKATPTVASSQELLCGLVPGARNMGLPCQTRFGMYLNISYDTCRKRVGLSRRVESSKDEGLGEEDASKQERINDIYANKDIYLVNVHTDEDMFDVNDLDGDEVIVDNVDVVKTVEETRSVVEEVTTVIEKAKLVSVAEETVNVAATTVSTASTIPNNAPINTTTTTATIPDAEITLAQALAKLKSAKPKAKKVVIQELEQGTTTTTPTTIIFIPKPPQDKGKGIMIEEPVVEQVKPIKRLKQMRLDEELAFKLQAKEEEKERLAREKAQQTKEATSSGMMFRTELVEESSKKAEAEIAQESSSKRAGDELEQENAKKQKVDEDKETAELQSLIEVVPDDEEEVAIDVVPLATKPPTIVDWKIHKEGKKSYYQIIRADGKSQIYRVFS
ncbi:hypothetical protein Tco_1044563 [Tanacetum coccineum]|uniref:Uncharacterized protein n=1 Tax=Tanacetum coccineum TaxID=301880 RepID=A0ABQ5GQM3_9ASTR